jgi:DNA-binding MarR family transcriptional regulator
VPTDDPHHRLLLAMLKAHHEAVRACNRVYRRFGVTHHQVQILRILETAGEPLTQGSIGEHLLVSRANLSGLIGRLASASLIRRRTPKRDRRVVMVDLTDAGREVLRAVRPLRETVESILFAELDPEEADRLTALLESVSSNAEGIG